MRSRIIKRIALVLAAPVLFIAAAEGLLRAIDFGHPTSFLVADTIDGRPVWRDNPYFGYRFFPERMTRTPQPIVLDRKKPEGIARVVVLGESAAMGEPQALFGPARFLEHLLKDRIPGKTCEVVNAAMTAINSHVIAEIVRDIARAEPDVLVLYIGNNEVVGPYGPGTVITPSSRLTRLRVLAGRLRLAQLFRARPGGSRWAGMQMFTEREVAADDPRMEQVYAAYRANLARIIDTGRAAGARIILCTVAVNLRDCAPFAGDAARAAFSQGRFAEARDLDALRFRADGRMNELVREIAASRPDVILADVEKLFGVAGSDLFIDHVHFTINGTYRLGAAVAEGLVRAHGGAWSEPPDTAACLEAMHYLPWNALDVTDAMLLRRSRPPFAGQPGNDGLQRVLLAQRQALRDEIGATDLAVVRQRFEAAMREAPDDWRLNAQWGEILLNAKEYAEAQRQLERERQLLPHRPELLGGLALLLAYQGKAGEGVGLLEHLPKASRSFAVEHLLQVSRALMEDRLVAEAEAFTAAALRLDPHDVDVQFELARQHGMLRGPAAAEAELRDIVARAPDHVPARNELAVLLARDRRWEEAESVLEAGPSDMDTRLRIVELKLVRGDLDAADRMLRELEAAGESPGPVNYSRGLWHMIRKEPALAVAAYERSIAARPDARTYYELARAYISADRIVDARKSIEASLALAPGNEMCMKLLASLPAAPGAARDDQRAGADEGRGGHDR